MQNATPGNSAVPDVSELLRAGGLTVPVPARSSDEAIPGIYNGLLDPKGAETLGDLLAKELAAYQPDGIVIWEDPHDIVLGYVVAHHMGVGAVRAYNADGLVEFEGTFSAEDRVALVATAFRTPEVVRAMCVLVRQQEKRVVGAASLVAAPASVAEEFAAQDVPHVMLHEWAGQMDGTQDG